MVCLPGPRLSGSIRNLDFPVLRFDGSGLWPPATVRRAVPADRFTGSSQPTWPLVGVTTRRGGAMPIITLPDGSQRSFDHPVSVAEVAQSIGAGLAKATIAGKVNGRLVDACDLIEADATLQIIRWRVEEGRGIIRHCCAHLVRYAVTQLYLYARLVIGPVLDEGFYYDVAIDRPFTPDNLSAIEARMAELIAKHYDV